MHAPVPVLETRLHARLPEALHLASHESAWVKARDAGPLHSFLEGPAFDREGRLFCVDLAHGRILADDGGGALRLVAAYDGEPNGLRFHRDGRLIIADRRHGVLAMAAGGGPPEVLVARAAGQPFQGINDLCFAADGSLYFTDQGDSDLLRPTGRVCRWREGQGEAEVLAEGLAGPNGLALSPDGRLLYVAITRDNAVYSLPLRADGGVGKVGRFLQLSGSPTGPDGLAVDRAGNLAVVHAGAGTVWLFSPLGEPLLRVRSCAGLRTTNLAYSGSRLFVTEAQAGAILCAEMPEAGLPLYSHAPCPAG